MHKMNPKGVKNDLKELLGTMDCNTERLAARGICQVGDNFMCLICDKRVLRIQGIPMHIAGKQHSIKLGDVYDNGTKIDGQFVCNLCNDYQAENWTSFIHHFHNTNHFVDLKEQKIQGSYKSSQYSNVSYIGLVQNQMIEYEPGIFFCCCCKKLITGWVSVISHISEKNHDELQKARNRDDFIGTYKEKDAETFAKNFVYHVTASRYHCNLCNRAISGLKNCYEHITGIGHTKNMITKESGNSQSPQQDVKANQNPKNPTSKLPKNVASESLISKLRENWMTGPSRKGNYHCKLCGCTLASPRTVSEHISGKHHKTMMEQVGNESSSATESEETSDGSSADWESTENSSDSWETYDCKSDSHESSENLSQSWESSQNATESWETISTRTHSSLESWESMLKGIDIPKNLIPQISNDLLQIREKEIYCVLCKAHLRNLESLVGHTNSKHHDTQLKLYRATIAKKNTKLLPTSGTSSAAKSSINPIKKVSSSPATKYKVETTTQNGVVEKPQGFYLPKHLIPLISEHLLKCRMKDYYCVACNATLKCPQDLINHTNSKYHVAELNVYRKRIAPKHQILVDSSGRNSASSSVSNTVSKKKLSESITTKHVANTIQKAVTKKGENSQTKFFKIPDHLVCLLSLHSLQHLGHEVFCPACHVHLQHQNTLIEHVNSKYHIATLAEYRSKQCQNNETKLKTISKNPQNPQSILMDIPQDLVPLIAAHSLKHSKDEIYCEACQFSIKTVENLVHHTRSPIHAAKLKLFQVITLVKNLETEDRMPLKLALADARKELEVLKNAVITKRAPKLKKITGISEKITDLENSLNKLTIAELKTQYSGAGNGSNLQQKDIVKTSNSNENSKKLPQKQMKNWSNRPTRRNGPQRHNPQQRNHLQSFDPKYLKVNMQHIYEVNPEKLRIIKLSCQLCFPKTSNVAYCLICEKSIDSKLQTFYEHICSISHTMYFAEVEKNDQYFINYPDQFSDLTLAKQFMQESSEETVQCFACDASMQNNNVVIREHINEDYHKERKQLWNKEMDEVLQNILVEMKSTWYNIQKYWCVPCDIEFNTEHYFAEHMDSKKHKDCVNKLRALKHSLVYDSCLQCTTVWLGVPGIYTQHCEQTMHKYLVQTGDYSICKLSNQVINLLKNAEVEVTKLIELSDQVLTVQKVMAESLLKCLEDTVKPEFPDAKAHPFGSRVSGLGFPDSDIDVFLDCGTYDGNKNDERYQVLILKSVERYLFANQHLWEIEETLTSSRTPIIKLYHRSTELRCDISFRNGLSVENTKLLKCFIDNYPLCRKLMLFLKKWFVLCNLSGSQYITNYAACWYVIFYLQRKSILPSIASLIAKEDKSKVIDGWETGICETFAVDDQEFTFTELLHGFFEFYANFDYRDSVACPLLGRTLLKQDFTQLHLLPKQMAPYINHITSKSDKGPVELFRIDSEMCIQDPYDLSHNLTKAVRKFTLNRFKRLCAASADILNDFIQH